MPTLEEMRRWARGEHIEGLPRAQPASAPKSSNRNPVHGKVPERFVDPNPEDFGGLRADSKSEFVVEKDPWRDRKFSGIDKAASGVFDPSLDAREFMEELSKGAVRDAPLTPPPSVVKKTGGGGKYKIAADGSDALIMFGKHTGKKLSTLAVTDPSYLRWLRESDFPADLKELAKDLQMGAKAHK